MIFEKCGKKKNLRGHFGIYLINYLTEFDMYINILLINTIFSRFPIFYVNDHA